jgi:glycosyltransferase involved in cell wall biosynthesis
MNILIVTPYPPVLHTHGGAVRMFHNIRILAQKHHVRVLSFVESDEEQQLLESAEPICDSVIPIRRYSDTSAHWFSLQPFMVREFSTPAMHKAVDDAVRSTKLDVIQCEYLQMAQYRRKGVFSVLTIHEIYSTNAYRTFQTTTAPTEKLQMFSRWMAMFNYEISMCNAFDRVVTMTSDDAAYLRSYAHRSNIRPIPIGIDPEHFSPVFDASCATPEVVFVGNYRHPPNVEAAKFLTSTLAPHLPQLTFVIAGSHLPEDFLKPPNALFPGYVSDTRQLFHPPNTIFAAPLFSGTGQRVKLLEAFAMEAAVVTTSLGAAGFPIVNGEHAIIANTPEEFRSAIATLASSPELRARLGRKARQMMLDRFTWDRIGTDFLSLVEESDRGTR